MKTVTLYSGAAGINNKVPAHRLPFSAETGVSALESAVDVIVDRTGEVVTRGGTSLLEEGVFHSLFPGKECGFIAKDRDNDTAIYQLIVTDSGATLTGLWVGLTKGARVDFCKVQDAVFFTNGYGNGVITGVSSGNPVAGNWVASTWPNEVSNVDFAAIPPAHHLCYNAGRMYFSIDEVIHYTEFGHLGIYDKATDGEHLPSKILAMAPAADGLYVSDSDSIYFLSSLNPHEWTSKKVADYPAKEWGKFNGTVDPSFFGFETNVPSSLFATDKGPLLLLPGGNVVNLIDKNVIMPGCPSLGAISVFDESLIIQTGE